MPNRLNSGTNAVATWLCGGNRPGGARFSGVSSDSQGARLRIQNRQGGPPSGAVKLAAHFAASTDYVPFVPVIFSATSVLTNLAGAKALWVGTMDSSRARNDPGQRTVGQGRAAIRRLECSDLDFVDATVIYDS